MKLTLSRNQAKGMLGMGSVTFEVRGQAQLTPDEAELVRHYKLDSTVLFDKPATLFGQPVPNAEPVKVTVRNLVNGEAFKCKDLAEVITYSESLEEACRNLKGYLEVARGFGGEEVIEI